MAVNKRIEGVEVCGFLVVHVCHQRPQMGVLADQRWGLPFVDERCGELASLVYAKLREKSADMEVDVL